MTTIYTPYTYLIGWSEHNKYYYGVRYAKKANPSELWITYYTSSPIVKRFVKKYGDPDIIQIRKIFLDRMSAINWEQKVLRKLDIKNNDRWLNGNLAGAVFKNLDHRYIEKTFLFTCPICKTKHKWRDLSKNRKKKTCGDKKCAAQHWRNQRDKQPTTWNKGLTKDDPRFANNIKKISEAKKGIPLSESHKAALRKPKRKKSAGFCSEVPADPKQSRCDC